MMLFPSIRAFLLFFLFSFLAACGGGTKPPVDTSKTIVFGTTIGDMGDMVKYFVAPALEKKGYKVKLLEFADYVVIHKNLADKNIDIDTFGPRAYVRFFNRTQKQNLIPIFPTPTAGIGIYSGLSSDLNTAKSPLTIAVPNDPTMLGRSLWFLEDLGFIKIRDGVDPDFITVRDIAQYKRPLKILELDAAGLPRFRQDVDFSIINGNYVRSSGMQLTEALAREIRTRQYMTMAVIRPEDKNSRWVKDVTEIYNSPEFQAYIQKNFQDYFLPESWGKAHKK